MVEQSVRASVGEGRSARRGLLRFVLENEGCTVVSEASSTLELAQQLVVHRPDVVVLDDGIDVSAVGMIREVLPSARVILVWPKGVSAVGADARLEPAEVMNALGPTIARVMGSAPVVPPVLHSFPC
jgi:chemotaxis response regulator CheB